MSRTVARQAWTRPRSSTLTSSMAMRRPSSRSAMPSSTCPRSPREVPRVVRAWPSHGPGADLPGHRDRLLAAGQCLGGVVQQHEQLAVGGQGAGQLLGRRLGRDDGHRPLDGGHGQGRVGGRPVVAGQPLQQRPGPPGLGGRVDPVQGQTAEGDGPLVVAGQVGRLGGPVQHRAPVQGAAGGRLRHLVPQLQGALVVPEGLGQGRGRLGGLPGLHAGHQRLPQVVGGVPVVGELATLDRPGPRPARSLALLNAALQRSGVGGMATSSSAKNGLPSERASTSPTSGGGAGSPRIPVSSPATSRRPSRSSSSRSARPLRSSSARNGRSGWRRCSSSDR